MQAACTAAAGRLAQPQAFWGKCAARLRHTPAQPALNSLTRAPSRRPDLQASRRQRLHTTTAAAAKSAERTSRRQQHQQLVQVEPDGSDAWRLGPVIDALKGGAVGIIPTDSNLAFVCDLGNRAAVEKLLELKRARGSQKMSILCRNLQDVDKYTLGWPVSQVAGQADLFKLVRRVLPGPYTFILHASKEMPKAVTNLDKGKSKKRHEVGVRMPDDPVAQAILQEMERPLLVATAAVSGNGGSGGDGEEDTGLTPDAAVLMDRYGPQGLDFIVDTGVRVVEGSTVIDCTGAEPVVVRQGKGDASFLD